MARNTHDWTQNMKLYGLKTCDTCRKAIKHLTAAGHDVTFVDVRADGVSRDDLTAFYDAFDNALVNTRSTTWRGLSEEQRQGSVLDLLAEYPTLMKRPVIDNDGSLSLGWSKEVQAKFL